MKRIKAIAWLLANIVLLGHLARRRARTAAEAHKIITQAQHQTDFLRASVLRRFRRAVYQAIFWNAFNSNPHTRVLPRRERRQAARNAAYHAFRKERGLSPIDSKSHRRRLLRGQRVFLAMTLPVEGQAQQAAS